jgi:hypothetical protein
MTALVVHMTNPIPQFSQILNCSDYSRMTFVFFLLNILFHFAHTLLSFISYSDNKKAGLPLWESGLFVSACYACGRK